MSGKKECPLCRKKVSIKGAVHRLKPDTPETPDFIDLLNLELREFDVTGYVTMIGDNILFVIHT